MLHDTLRSLTAIMTEETALLRIGRRDSVAELAAAKIKLTAQLERLVAEREREDAHWRERLEPEPAAELAEAIEGLQAAAAENAQVVRRQIDLSRELLDAIAAEARRLTGTTSETYAPQGTLRRLDLPAPISVNASL